MSFTSSSILADSFPMVSVQRFWLATVASGLACMSELLAMITESGVFNSWLASATKRCWRFQDSSRGRTATYESKMLAKNKSTWAPKMVTPKATSSETTECLMKFPEANTAATSPSSPIYAA